MNWRKLIDKFTQKKIDTSEFDHLMLLAYEICKADPRGLTNLLKLTMRPFQAQRMISVAEMPVHSAQKFFTSLNVFTHHDIDYLFFDYDFPRLQAKNYTINLATDIVIPYAFKRASICETLSHHGKGRLKGEWTSLQNHRIHVWMPWGIGLVAGGSHSITAGIVNGYGELNPSEVIDKSILLDRIRCDGENFIDQKNGEIITRVKDQRTAAAFEIGRLMREYKITPLTMQVP